MRALLVFLFITVVSSDINMATKFKLFNPAKADGKTGEILCNGRTGVVTETTRSFQDKNCWDFINFSKSKCIDVSQVIRRPFSVIELQGWDSVQLFESDDCSGEDRLLKKDAIDCDQQKRSPGGQKTNYWKCKVSPFRSIAGSSYSQNSSFENELEKCTPAEEMVTLLSVDYLKGTLPAQASYTERVISVYIQPNATTQKGAASNTSNENGGELSVPMQKILSVRQRTRLANKLRVNLSGSKHDWNSTDVSTILQEKTKTRKLVISPGVKTIIEQVVGVCGNFKVYTDQFIRQDLYVNGTVFVSR
ncbi:uncharacterized protein LOC110849669 [Folsomia candida]|uniref:uncharacterized protein LOC110849669 n=1 Tax=Folsomia candida TaxID=158441 RepID=UPI000B901CAD|nr:uncharacterized protein LOC110849669 [Folsomia candida]